MDIENEQTKRLNDNDTENLSENTDGVLTENFVNDNLNEPYEIHMADNQQRKEENDKARIDFENSKKSLGKMVKRFRRRILFHLWQLHLLQHSSVVRLLQEL